MYGNEILILLPEVFQHYCLTRNKNRKATSSPLHLSPKCSLILATSVDIIGLLTYNGLKGRIGVLVFIPLNLMLVQSQGLAYGRTHFQMPCSSCSCPTSQI